MQAWQAALWGALGGAVVEAYDLVAVTRATRRWPWLDPDKPSDQLRRTEQWNLFGIWLFATVMRIGAGAGGAAAASGQISGELAAFGVGVAGPLAVERILALVHVESPHPAPGPTPADSQADSPSRATPLTIAIPADPPAASNAMEET